MSQTAITTMFDQKTIPSDIFHGKVVDCVIDNNEGKWNFIPKKFKAIRHHKERYKRDSAILKVTNKLTIKSKEQREKAKIQTLLKKEKPVSLSDLDSKSSKEDKTIFTDATAVQREEVLEKATPEELV